MKLTLIEDDGHSFTDIDWHTADELRTNAVTHEAFLLKTPGDAFILLERSDEAVTSTFVGEHAIGADDEHRHISRFSLAGVFSIRPVDEISVDEFRRHMSHQWGSDDDDEVLRITEKIDRFNLLTSSSGAVPTIQDIKHGEASVLRHEARLHDKDVKQLMDAFSDINTADVTLPQDFEKIIAQAEKSSQHSLELNEVRVMANMARRSNASLVLMIDDMAANAIRELKIAP